MTLNCKGNLIDLTSPKVMGILNITPDSFYDGGKYNTDDLILKQTEKMLSEGATFIDLGAYSSRPGAKDISEEEELKRIEPVVKLLLNHFPELLLSIDTFRSNVAKRGLDMGAAMINDISGGDLDAKMLPTVAQYQAPYIMMHMKGNPQNMSNNTNYKKFLEEILFYFSEKIAQAVSLGIRDIVLDPGFGFAKNTSQNFELLKNLNLLKTFRLPILAGISRKSMIYKTLEVRAKDALNGSTALHMVALNRGANILRVHDVKEAVECVKLYNALQ